MPTGPLHRAIRFLFILCLSLLSLAGVLPAEGAVILPAATAAVEGDNNNSYPFNCVNPGPSMRYQQVYLGTEVGTGEILELRFRQDGEFGMPFGPTTVPSVVIQLSSTTAGPFGPFGGLSLVFADNVGADATTVFSGNLVLSSSAGGGAPREFDIAVPLSTRFSFDAGSGDNLLLDVIFPVCPGTTSLDAEFVVGDSVARAASFNANSPVANFSDSLGLVTRFVVLVFEDGFESGDTSSWSATVP